MKLVSQRGASRALLALIAPGWASCSSSAICSVSSQGVSFGNYDPFQPSSTDGVGDVSLNCDAVVNATISLSTGTGTYETRIMDNGRSQLAYNLYADSQRIQVWGDGSGGSNTVSRRRRSGDIPVYGTIPALQNVTAGGYQDTIIITVTF